MPDGVQEAAANLAGIDIVIVVMYMAGVFILGTFFGKYVKSAGDFFVAGRALPFWAIGMSIVVSDIGAMDFVAVAGSAYTDGVAAANFDWIGSMPAMVFAAFVFVPYFWRSGVYTIPEWLGRRYSAAVQLIHGGIWGVFMLTMLALMLWATADELMNTILGVDPRVMVWIIVGITGIYTFSGGLSAVVMVDVVQLIIMFVGGLALLALCMWEVGGPGALKDRVDETHPRVVIGIHVEQAMDAESLEGELQAAGIPVQSVLVPSKRKDDDPARFLFRLEQLAQAENQVEGDRIRNAQYNREKTKAALDDILAKRAAFHFDEAADVQSVQDVVAAAGLTVAQADAVVPSGAEEATSVYLVLTELSEDADHTRELLETAAKDCGAECEFPESQLISYEDHFTILLPHDTDKPYPWTGIVFGLGIVLAIAYMSGNQAVVQRTLGARSEWDAKGGMLFGGFLKSFIPLMVAVPGLCAIAIAPDLAEGDRAVPHMIAQMLPPGLKGLMFVALFAALMSSVDSTLNSATTIWTTDLYGRLTQFATGRPLTERHALIVGRTFTLAFIILAGIMAPYMQYIEGLYVFIQSALSMFQGPTLAILLLGIVWRRATRWGGLAGLVLGVMFTTILNMVDDLFPSDDPFLFVAWWSFVFSCIVTIVVSLLTPPEPEEKIRGLVWGQVMKDGEIQRVLGERVS